jgi:2-hydroxychromene-2-carboxylate isomerase
LAHIDYYLSTLSPYTYLAGLKLEQVAARHGASITYKPLDIAALFGRTGGQPPKDRHPSRQDYRLQELRRQSKKTGLTLNLKPAFWPTNPAPSCYAVIAAQAAVAKGAEGDIGALAHGFTRACWAEERDIADADVIAEVMSAAGFDPAIADRGMMMAADTYVSNLEEAVTQGVFGAPFYVVGSEKFWGQDRLDDLDAYLAGSL